MIMLSVSNVIFLESNEVKGASCATSLRADAASKRGCVVPLCD